jgi:hypothetical protein
MASTLIHIHGTSWGTSPCFKIFFPLFMARSIGGNDPSIIAIYVHCDKYMKNIAAELRIDKVTWKIFIIRIFFDDFILPSLPILMRQKPVLYLS